MIADEVQAGGGRMGGFWGFRCNGLKDGNVDIILKFRPSLAWNRANMDTFIAALDKSLTAIG